MTDLRLDTALRFSRAGLPIIALYGPTEGDANQRGKRPRSTAWQVAKQTPERLAAHFAQAPDSNLGCVTGLMSGLVLLDIDPRNGGGEWLKANVERVKADGAQVERTGSGGFHLWWAHPGAGLWVPSKTGKHGIAPGVELLADGGHQAVIAPSIHHTGTVYEWQGSMPFEDVRDFGAVLPGWIAVAAASAAVLGGGARRDRTVAEVYGDHPADVEACRARLEDFEPAVEGAGGDSQTFRASCFGRDHNLSPEAFRPLLQAWSARCSPPWGLEELERKLANGYQYAKAEQTGQRSPSRAFSAVSASGPEVDSASVLTPVEAAAQVAELTSWKDGIVLNRDHTWKSHVRNLELVLRHDDRLARCFRYNLFTNTVELVRPPWRGWTSTGPRAMEWIDDDEVCLAAWIAASYAEHPAMGVEVVRQAVRPYARLHSYHPVRDYLQGLTWDTRPRLSTWAVRYLGVIDSEYARAVGPRFLIGAVARIMRPGCKLDTMLVAEGRQGLGKSTAVRILFDPWYTDAELDPANKETSSIIRGHWGVEFGEMHGARRAEVTQLKAFLSRREDRQRDAYGHAPETHPRQSVFIGTTNSTDYLLDQTGGRRFWPLTCGRIDLEHLAADRDQLWAEAYVRQQLDETWWLTEAEEVHAKVEQAQRRTVDEAEDLIAGWVARGGDFGPASGTAEKVISPLSRVTGIEVWTGALGGSPVTFRRLEQQRVADCMRALGWTRTTFRREGQVIRGYAKGFESDIRPSSDKGITL